MKMWGGQSWPRPPFQAARAGSRAELPERINQYLLENLDDAAWNAEPPGGKGRTIAAIAAHMHNVRHMWLVAAAKGKPRTGKLDGATVTWKEAMRALAESASCCAQLLKESLGHPEGKVKGFRPDVVGVCGDLISHDAHHRGQICALARQLGHPLPKQATFGMWSGARAGRNAASEVSAVLLRPTSCHGRFLCTARRAADGAIENGYNPHPSRPRAGFAASTVLRPCAAFPLTFRWL